jgi:phospho-N-acetylmuramoyl-pentapeptide-transferase
MTIEVGTIELLRIAILHGIFSCVIAFLWAPILTNILYRFRITRRSENDDTLQIDSRVAKTGTPIMGGLLIIVTVIFMTYLFNWERKFTWMPILIMTLSATLGGIDDIMNIHGKNRRSRNISHILRLIKVHSSLNTRIWLILTLPWSIFKRGALWLGSRPGKGVHVHEKLLFQFIAGTVAAWWIYFKLGEHWQRIHIPFDGSVDIGIWLIPLIIFFIIATANAVNVADGMDGLAGGSLLITFSALTVLAWILGYQSIAILNSVTAGALLTYTYFNIKPARFQMGDVGSLGLGALLATNIIVMDQMLLLPLFGFIFFVELGSVIIQVFSRHILGKRIFRMAPLHHHFELSGWSEEKTVMRFWIIHAFFVFFAMFVALI